MSEGENDIMNIFTYTNFRELSTDTNMAFASGEDGSITSWQRFVYRGYLQIAAFDVNSVIIDEEEHQGHALATTTFWDPMEPTATRPLAITDHSGNTSTTYFHTHDLTKNVCELLDSTGTIITSYDYTPFGAVTASNSSTPNTFCFSSEVLDPETSLVYYNYRYYSPELGRWINRDPIAEAGGVNLYNMAYNRLMNCYDLLGAKSSKSVMGFGPNASKLLNENGMNMYAENVINGLPAAIAADNELQEKEDEIERYRKEMEQKRQNYLNQQKEHRLDNYVELNEIANEVDYAIKNTSWFGKMFGNSGNNLKEYGTYKKRYIYSCKYKDFIDLQHLISAASLPLSQYGMGSVLGIGIEFGQALIFFDRGAQHSAFKSEDLRSNYYGDVSAGYDSNKSLGENVQNVLSSLDVISYTEAVQEIKCPGSICNEK